MALDGALQRPVGDELQTRVDRKHHIGTHFAFLDPDVLDDAPEAVTDDAA